MNKSINKYPTSCYEQKIINWFYISIEKIEQWVMRLHIDSKKNIFFHVWHKKIHDESAERRRLGYVALRASSSPI